MTQTTSKPKPQVPYPAENEVEDWIKQDFGKPNTETRTKRVDELLRGIGHTYVLMKELLVHDLTPHASEVKMDHSHPMVRNELSAHGLYIRKRGWIAVQYLATIRGLDLYSEADFRTIQWAYTARWRLGQETWLEVEENIWDHSRPVVFPEEIPVTAPTAKERRRWNPNPTQWDVQDAAFHELELHMGGMANIILHDQLLDPNDARLRVRARVETYLQIHMAKVPEDPWDPNNWGHDARLETLSFADLNRPSDPYVLTPSFDSDVLAYTVNQPLTGISITATAVDTLANVSHDLSSDKLKLTITVTAKDGTTKRVYTVSIED